MKRKELFMKMLEQAKKENLFLGTGNPESNILIVGKEASIREDSKEQIDREIRSNIPQWERDVNKQLSEIADRDWWIEGNFSPLYPCKGQIKKRDSRIRNEKAKYNFGTSPTWLNYQKMRDAILGTCSDVINFHENCFITELNQITSRYSKEQNKLLRKEMIDKRLETIFPSEYIQSFPIVILACGTYIYEHKIDVCSLFGVEKYGQKEVDFGSNKKQWYVMYKSIHKDSPKIVIHTWQLSMCIKNELIGMMGKDIADFCKENKISL